MRWLFLHQYFLYLILKAIHFIMKHLLLLALLTMVSSCGPKRLKCGPKRCEIQKTKNIFNEKNTLSYYNTLYI